METQQIIDKMIERIESVKNKPQRLTWQNEPSWKMFREQLDALPSIQDNIQSVENFQREFEHSCLLNAIILVEREAVTGYGGWLTSAGELNDLLKKELDYLDERIPKKIESPTSSEVQKQENEPSDAESQKTQPSSTFEKIVWTGTEDQLVYIFDKLIENGFISAAVNIHAFVASCFLNNKGRPFKREQLAIVKQKLLDSGKPNKKSDVLDNILSRASQIK